MSRPNIMTGALGTLEVQMDVGSSAHTVEFAQRHVQPWSRSYVTADDVLVLKVFNPSQSVTVNLSLRLLTPEGEIIPQFNAYANLAASSSPQSFIIRSAEGFLLSATVSTPGAPSGSAYVQLGLARGTGANDQTEGDLLLAGYPGSFTQIGYPASVPQPPSSGAGLARTVIPTAPIAGADWQVTVPAGVIWTLQSVTAQLQTSATVANRIPDLQIQDASGNIIQHALAGVAQTAGLTDTWSWSPGSVTSTVLGTLNTVNLPAGLRLSAGWKVRTITANLQATDLWSSIFVSVAEFIAA
jgi:hypothetical protein